MTGSTRLVAVMRSPAVRGLFAVGVAVAATVVLASQWRDVSAILVDLPAPALGAAFILGVVYVVMTMLSWRATLGDLGSPLGLRAASDLFFVSQVAKYVPGSIWNVLAVAEMGTQHHTIPRRRSVAAMAVWWLVTLGTALTVAALAAPLFPPSAIAKYIWLAALLPVCLIALAPPVLNRLIRVSLGWAGQVPLDVSASSWGIARSALWAVGAWVAAGTQVWVLATATGSMPSGPRMLALVTAGFAIAWCVGFLFVPAPAGVGVREAALAAFLLGELGTPATLVTVLVSRLAITLADVLLGAGALGFRRLGERPRPADSRPGPESQTPKSDDRVPESPQPSDGPA